MEAKIQKALDVLIDCFGSINSLQRELTKYFHAYVITDDFSASDEAERQRIVSSFEFVIDYFEDLKILPA